MAHLLRELPGPELRVRRFRSVNFAMMALWALLAAAAVVTNLEPGPVVVGALSAIALYFLAAGLLRRAD